MPITAAFIDDLRAAFGKEAIDLSIRRGLAGREGWFVAHESGHQVGTPFAMPKGVTVAQMKSGLQEGER